MADRDLLTGFYFSVRISGESSGTDAAFQEVSGLSQETAIEEVISGGENRFNYRLPGHTRYSNLILKRGVAQADSPLIEWCQETMDDGLRNPIQTKNIIVSLFDEQGLTRLSWNFVKAYPVKWSMSELKSQDSNLLVETIELAYQYYKADDSRINQYAAFASLFGDA
ncbi:phage tail protein [Pseudomonas syringae]|uniref:Phage tail protein n=1 Tax=Pseudomonas syringae TaxID=317 RepID=A0A244EQS3_PSESX|nr:phage tail protein [Pseudomonas syringae]MCI3944230.1 phage tail protein [Pseudomonas syringae]OUM06834.1 phage tail protein [Pseudomonas syringae]